MGDVRGFIMREHRLSLVFNTIIKFFFPLREVKLLSNSMACIIPDSLKEIEMLSMQLDEMEKSMCYREQAYEKLLKLVNELVWETDKNGFYIYVSPKLKEVYGYSDTEVIGKRPEDFVTIKEKSMVAAMSRFLVDNRESINGFVALSHNSDGTIIFTSNSCVPRFDTNDDFIGHIGVEVLITEGEYREKHRKQKEMFDLIIGGSV